MKETVFITGATGNIGATVVLRILRDYPDRRLVLLVRGCSDNEAAERLAAVLHTFEPELEYDSVRDRISVYAGDVTRVGLGLSPRLLCRLTKEVTHIIHAAASTQFQLSLKKTREVNFAGTRNVLVFARQVQQTGRLRRVAYISTSYVCGTTEGTIYEDGLIEGCGFSNTYEQGKWETEKLVRDQMHTLPIVIFRPSSVVGDSRTGRIQTLNVLYPCLHLIYLGLLRDLPCCPGAPLDVVSVDYVSRAIGHIFFRRNDCIGETYHLVEGCNRPMTVGQIAIRALNYFKNNGSNGRELSIRFVPPDSYFSVRGPVSARERHMQRVLSVYRPHLTMRRAFDDTNTRRALARTGIGARPLSTYLERILSYCIQSNWGKQLQKAA